MSVVDRKLCAGCGEPNLGSDLSCWACGGTQFAPLNARLAGERTVHLPHPLEVTQEWERERPRWMPLVYLGTAAAFALFMWIVGFWIGRSSGEPPAVAQVPAPSAPIVFPTPPVGTGSAGSAPSYSSMAPAAQPISPDPPVQVRTASNPAQPPVPPKAAPPTPPTTVVFNSPGRSPAPTPRVYTQFRPAAPLPIAPPRLPATSKTSVLSLRNDTSVMITVKLTGGESQTASVGAGSTIRLPLPPGKYDLQVSSSAAASNPMPTVLKAGESYLLVVEGSLDEGSSRLIIEEPALGGG